MKKEFCILFLFTIMHSLSAQNGYFVKFSTNYSIIPSYSDIGKEINYRSKPGFSLLAGFDKKLSNRLALKLGAGFNALIMSKEYTYKSINIESDDNISNPDSGNNSLIVNWDDLYTEFYTDSFRMNLPGDYREITNLNAFSDSYNLFYLTVPVFLKCTIVSNRLAAEGGIAPSILMFSKEIKHMYEDANYSGDGFNNLVFQAHLNISCRVYKQLWIIAGINQSFTNIYDNIDGSSFIFPLDKNTTELPEILENYQLERRAFPTQIELGVQLNFN